MLISKKKIAQDYIQFLSPTQHILHHHKAIPEHGETEF